jgi:hypothetical protein
MACLDTLKRHLEPGGVLAIHLDHQDVGWLAEVRGPKRGVFTNGGAVTHPATGHLVRAAHAWSYEPATQTASVVTSWEEIDGEGRVVGRWQRAPMRLHCLFRFEMEHLLRRAGYTIQAVYGDFGRGALRDESAEMIWVARLEQGCVSEGTDRRR